jgi:hypothetical protein
MIYKKHKKGTGYFFWGLSLLVLVVKEDRDCPLH